MSHSLEQIAREFIQTLQDRKSAEDLIRFYHDDIEQVEFPNTLTRNKTIRDLNDLKMASEKGKKVLLKEELQNPIALIN